MMSDGERVLGCRKCQNRLKETNFYAIFKCPQCGEEYCQLCGIYNARFHRSPFNFYRCPGYRLASNNAFRKLVIKRLLWVSAVSLIVFVLAFVSLKFDFAYGWALRAFPFLILNGLVIAHVRTKSNLEGSTWIHLLWTVPLGIVSYINPYYFIMVLLGLVAVFGVFFLLVCFFSSKNRAKGELMSLASDYNIPGTQMFIEG